MNKSGRKQNLAGFSISVIMILLIIFSIPTNAMKLISVNVSKPVNFNDQPVRVSMIIQKESLEVIQPASIYAVIDNTYQSTRTINCTLLSGFDVESNASNIEELGYGYGYLNINSSIWGYGYGYGYGHGHENSTGYFMCTFEFANLDIGNYSRIDAYINNHLIGTENISLSVINHLLISNINAMPGSTSTLITFDTNIPANTTVRFNEHGNTSIMQISNSSLSTQHAFMLTNLKAGTSYDYIITSCNEYECVSSQIRNFTTHNQNIIGDASTINSNRDVEVYINGGLYNPANYYDGQVDVKIIDMNGHGIEFYHNLGKSSLNLTNISMLFGENFLAAKGFTNNATFFVEKDKGHLYCNVHLTHQFGNASNLTNWFLVENVDDLGNICAVHDVSGSTAEDYNVPPVIVTDRYIEASPNEIITLSASESYDIDGDIVSYRWYDDGYRLLSTASEFRTVFNEGIHNITLYVFDNGGLSAAENITIKVSKEFLKIKGERTVLVNSIRIDNSVDISADNILHTVATVYNNMGEDMHNLKFSVMIPGLGIYHTSAINLNKGKSAVITNNFELPKDIAPGEYDVRFTISNDLVKRTKHSTIIIK